MIKYVLNIHL